MYTRQPNCMNSCRGSAPAVMTADNISTVPDDSRPTACYGVLLSGCKIKVRWQAQFYSYASHAYVSCCNSEKMVKIGVNLRSYRKINTLLSLFWTTLLVFV